jgi:HPr kinase/phosphorylase
VQKSGLALVGHFHGLESWRLQILGATELSFLERLDPVARRRACDGFAGRAPCAVVITRGVDPLPELAAACERSGTPLLGTDQKSSTTINAFHAFLDHRLAPRTRIHGVLVVVFGIGVLLLGRSGIGKSECALDLVMRGHRLVADDVVECALIPVTGGHGTVGQRRKVILGAPAQLLEHHIEIRGLGILNVKDLFGVTSVCDQIVIDLVVRLSDADDGAGIGFDRLGVDERFHTILGVQIPEVTVPVRPGRDVAAILQIAARNELLKRAGHHGAREFRDKLERALLGEAGQHRSQDRRTT